MNCYEELDSDKLDILTRCSYPHTEVPVYHCENICPAHFGALCKTNYALIILSTIFLILVDISSITTICFIYCKKVNSVNPKKKEKEYKVVSVATGSTQTTSLKQRAVKLQVHGDEIDSHFVHQNYEATRSTTAIETVTVPSTPVVAKTGEMVLTQRKVQTPPLSARRSSEEIYKTSTPDIAEHEMRNYVTNKNDGENVYDEVYHNPTHISPIVEQDVFVQDVIDDEIHKQLDLLDATRLDMTRNEPEVANQSTYNQYQYQLQSTGESYSEPEIKPERNQNYSYHDTVVVRKTKSKKRKAKTTRKQQCDHDNNTVCPHC